MLTWVSLYLCIGLANYGWWALEGHAGAVWRSDKMGGFVELVVFVLFWWVQLAFQIVVGVGSFFSWLGGKVMG